MFQIMLGSIALIIAILVGGIFYSSFTPLIKTEGMTDMQYWLDRHYKGRD